MFDFISPLNTQRQNNQLKKFRMKKGNKKFETMKDEESKGIAKESKK